MKKIDKLAVERPWGKFEQFTKEDVCTVKIIRVNPNSKLSLQYHNHRDEFWYIIDGEGQVVIGEKTHPAKAGDEFTVPVKTKHRIMTKDSPLVILEISFGKFDEEDIVRIEDIYNRI